MGLFAGHAVFGVQSKILKTLLVCFGGREGESVGENAGVSRKRALNSNVRLQPSA